MKIITAPDNIAVLSNVTEVSSFKVKQSAAAFKILSNSLYANKVRAIVRELSANAWDSHNAAGKADVPIEVHLPSFLEPWFYVKDYGIGLTHEQVINVYTTYFESTKADCNLSIGGFGLGSKTPFAYTENFSITAIKDGVQNDYSAYINDDGFPDIARLGSTPTTESNGVEVKFSVQNKSDYASFEYEAQAVYKFYTVKPNFVGLNKPVKISPVEYLEKDIIPGVHLLKDSNRSSIAIMGQIAYPINIPKTESPFGDLQSLLQCDSLVMNFEIGELEVQPSREGLSYSTTTITSIVNRLTLLRDSLLTVVEEKAILVDNLWERTDYLVNLFHQNDIWISPIAQYIVNTKNPLIQVCRNYRSGMRYMGSIRHNTLALYEDELASKFNIKLKIFNRDYDKNRERSFREFTDYAGNTSKIRKLFEFEPKVNNVFVKNESISRVVETVKKHPFVVVDSMAHTRYGYNIFVMMAHDKEKPVLYDEFLASIHNPMNVYSDSELNPIVKTVTTQPKGNFDVLKLEEDNGSIAYKWKNHKNASSITDTVKYYVPLSGFKSQSEKIKDIAQVYSNMVDSQLAIFNNMNIYGVMKKDIKDVSDDASWVLLEDYIIDQLSNLDISKLRIHDVHYGAVVFKDTKTADLVSKNSLYCKMKDQYSNTTARSTRAIYAIHSLVRNFTTRMSEITDVENQYKIDMDEVYARYPLLIHIDEYSFKHGLAAQYINLIDQGS